MVAHEKIVRDLIKWIDLHIEGRLKIEDVAEKSGYSKWHLQRMFLQVTGETLGCYIRKKKLYFALSELLLTDHSIYQIALTYGFDTQQSFTRVFKNQFGLPPAMFRREAKEKLPFRSELIKYPYQDNSLKF